MPTFKNHKATKSLLSRCIFSAGYSAKFPNGTTWFIFVFGAFPRSSIFFLITFGWFLLIPENSLCLWDTWFSIKNFRSRFLRSGMEAALTFCSLMKGSFLSGIHFIQSSLHLLLFDSFIVYFLFVCPCCFYGSYRSCTYNYKLTTNKNDLQTCSRVLFFLGSTLFGFPFWDKSEAADRGHTEILPSHLSVTQENPTSIPMSSCKGCCYPGARCYEIGLGSAQSQWFWHICFVYFQRLPSLYPTDTLT